MFRTLRSRLTALATGITCAVSLLVCIVLYVGIRYSLYREVDTFLAGEVMEFQTLLAAAGDDLAEVQKRVRAELGSREHDVLEFHLIDADGRVLLTSRAGPPQPDLWPVPEQHPSELFFRTEAGPGPRDRTRTCSRWLAGSNGRERIVQATYRLDQVNASLNRFGIVCAAALALATVLALTGGMILARRGLLPIAAMTAKAKRIGMENIADRIARSGHDDELDQLAATFNEMLERLENQIGRLKQFTADAAHELRTPLAALRGNAEVALSADRPSAELRATLADSIDEYDRLTRLADDLLLLARADAERGFLRRERFRLDLAASDVADLFRPLAEDRAIQLSVGPLPPTWIVGDEARIRQVLSNLLDNAIKFTPGGGKVDLSIAAGGEFVETLVRDTGVGIAAENRERVFDRFFRVDAARSRDSAGSGLGLAICRSIVSAHGGTITLGAAEPHGTIVVARLPAA